MHGLMDKHVEHTRDIAMLSNGVVGLNATEGKGDNGGESKEQHVGQEESAGVLKVVEV